MGPFFLAYIFVSVLITSEPGITIYNKLKQDLTNYYA